LSGGLGSGQGWRGCGVPGEFASGSCSAASSAVRVVAASPGDELDGWRSADQDPVPPVRRNSCSRGRIRATYGGETRRTSKIHWRKGRSTVTGQLLSCDNEDSSVRVPELRRGIFVVNPRPSLCPVCALSAGRAAAYDSEDCSMRSAAGIARCTPTCTAIATPVEVAANRGKLGGRRGGSRTTRWQKGIFDDTGQLLSEASDVATLHRLSCAIGSEPPTGR
jgi:hypothetical protein